MNVSIWYYYSQGNILCLKNNLEQDLKVSILRFGSGVQGLKKSSSELNDTE